MAVGNRIYTQRQLPPREVIEGLRACPAANVGDCMFRLCAMHPSIRLMSAPQLSMCGPALTVHTRAGDNFFLHKALDMAKPGDVIVVSTGFGEMNSLLGEIMASNALHNHLGGIVLDAPIRDSKAITAMSLPIYATGTTPGGPLRAGPGEINTPIACGSVVVCPGDIVLGDADGVVVIPAGDAAAVLEKARAYMQKDAQTLEAAINGTWDRGWIPRMEKDTNVEIIDGVCPR